MYVFGFLSDNEGVLNVGSIGIPGQFLNFAVETGGPISGDNYISAAFRFNAATDIGYSAEFFAAGEAPGVPDGGMTVSLLGLGLVGIALMRRKLALI